MDDTTYGDVMICYDGSDRDPLFMCSSNSVRYDSTTPTAEGQPCTVSLKPFSESCSYLQYRVPLTAQHPYFSMKIELMSVASKVAVGIAADHIRDDIHLGCHNNSIGYHSDSGAVISNHCSRSQTKPPKYTVGDTIGMCVTHFGEEKSSIMIVKNGRPVCTKYHYERNHHQYYPTVTLQHGPVVLAITWHTSFSHPNIPQYLHTDPNDWLVMPGFCYDSLTDTFCVRDHNHVQSEGKMSLSSLQGPQPLSPERSYYEVELVESSLNSRNPSLIICLVSCGAHLSAPSSSLYYEVLKFTINYQAVKSGDKLGWGVHYLSPLQDGDILRQPIVCCVTLNGSFQTSVCYMEPEGGYYPFIAFTPNDFRLRINMAPTRLPFNLLPIQTVEHQSILLSLLELEKATRRLLTEDIMHSEHLIVDLLCDRLKVTLCSDIAGVHTLQYCGHPLTRERPVFQVNITKLTEDSVLCVGIAGRFSSSNRYPGRGMSSLGYHSRDGKILYDGRSQANTQGHRFTEGDQIMIEVCPLPKSSGNVMVRVWKNELPVALRYLDIRGNSELYATVSLFANGSAVCCEVITPNMIEQLPTYYVNNLMYWCLPCDAHVALDSTEVYVINQPRTGHCIVCPLPMSRGMHHFEVRVLVNPQELGVVPPMIALTTVSPYDPPRESNFHLDLLRFWPRNDGYVPTDSATLVRKGDTMGWGVIFPDDDLSDSEEQIVLCYLTINRNVILTRALIQPAGGLHATVVLPYGCERVRLDFEALTIHSHPFTRHNVQQLYKEAQSIVEEEREAIASGVELPFEHKRLQDFYKPLPVESGGDPTPHRMGEENDIGIHSTDKLIISKRSKTCIIL